MEKEAAAPKLSIIIVSYNSREVTAACLESLRRAEWRDVYEVIVVDNASADGSVEMIRERFPEVRLLANPGNLFFARANNQGAAAARGEYLLLLNSDTLVDGDNLQRLLDFATSQREDVVCVGPRVDFPDGRLQSRGEPDAGNVWQHLLITLELHRLGFVRRLWPEVDRRPDVTHRTGWVVGCCMMIPRRKYLEVGGLNEQLQFYGEEPEFGWRTRKMGLKTIYYSGARIVHLGGMSTKNNGKGYADADDASGWAWYDRLVDLTFGRRRALFCNRVTLMSLLFRRAVRRTGVYDAAIGRQRALIGHLTSNPKLSGSKS